MTHDQPAASLSTANARCDGLELQVPRPGLGHGVGTIGPDGQLLANTFLRRLAGIESKCDGSRLPGLPFLRRALRTLRGRRRGAMRVCALLRRAARDGTGGSVEIETRHGHSLRFSVEPAAGQSLSVVLIDQTVEAVREQALIAEIRRFHAAIESLPHGLCLFDRNHVLKVCNRRYVDLYRLPPNAIRPGLHFRDVLTIGVAHGLHGSRTVDEIYEERLAMVRGERDPEAHQTLADGRTIKITYRPAPDGGWVVLYEDISAEVAAERALTEQNRRFNAALEHMHQGLCMFDDDFRMLVVNQRYIDMYGVSPEVVRPGAYLRDVMEHSVRLGVHVETSADRLFQSYRQMLIDNPSATLLRELRDGRSIWVSHRPMAGGGWVATFEDVTERRRAETRIAHMARHDAVTGLPNRVELQERLGDVLDRARATGAPAAVCFLDLDRFKAINDSFGHAAGDALLQAVAQRLGTVVGPEDTIARLGGDEFSILKTSDLSDLAGWASRLIDLVSAPYEVGDLSLSIGTSVGIAMVPEHGVDSAALLKRADLALYRAKSLGRGTWCLFEPGMDEAAIERAGLEADLKAALAQGQLALAYQPQVGAKTGELVGCEALVRWHHPKRGAVSPSDFVQVAEESGLIIRLGEWVLRTACREAAGWPAQLRIAVNVSASQLRHGNFDLTVLAALADSGLPPGRLELEITESVILDDAQGAVASLKRLRDLGIRISLDDFGTGYSSLGLLRSFPFDRIKIDRSFVHGLNRSHENVAIVTAVAELARKLNMATTAEGVETDEQLAIVTNAGCTEVQGYLFSRPMYSQELARYLRGSVRGRQRLGCA